MFYAMLTGKIQSPDFTIKHVIGKIEYVEMNFAEIPKEVLEGKVDAGLVIHETQLSYDQEKLTKILDVGEWWDKTTNGLPVPLGINVINNRLGSDIIKKFDNYLRDSINYAL